MSLYFDITPDNFSFAERMNEINASIQNSSEAMKKLANEFDLSTVEGKIIALNKVIRDNESAIVQSSNQIMRWRAEAAEALNAKDFSTFDSLNKKIEDQVSKTNDLVAETKEYQSILASLGDNVGATDVSNVTENDAPQFFKSQKDFEYADSLRKNIDLLQLQISEFNGSPVDMQNLRSALSVAQQKLRGCELAAAKAAAELGPELGKRAAEASEKLYLLNKAVEEQKCLIGSLSDALKKAEQNLQDLQESGDTSAIEDAQIWYDSLSVSLQNAEMEMINFRSAQTEASSSFAEINQEIEAQDSVIVKMFGSYDNYKTILENLPGPIQSLIGGLNGMTGAAKAFIATPLGLAIGAIVLALQALTTWFDSSVEGQLAFAKISGYVGGVLDKLKDIVADIGKAIYEAFTNPKQALASFWEALQTNVVNRFKALGGIFKETGAMLESLFKGNWSGMGHHFKELINYYTQAITGVTKLTDKVKDGLDSLHTAGKTGAELEKEKRQIEIDEGELKKKSEERMKVIKDAKRIYQDNSSSPEEKEKAKSNITRLTMEENNANLDMIDRKLAYQQGKLNNKGGGTIEENGKLAELQAEKTRLQAKADEDEAELKKLFAGGNSKGNSGLLNTGSSHLPSIAKSQEDIKRAEEKQREAHQRVMDIMKQQYEERIRLETEHTYLIWQNRIDLMEEGEAKILEQMKLDNEKERALLEERKKQAIAEEISRQQAIWDAKEDEKAVQDKNYSKQKFNGDLEDENNDLNITEIKKIIELYDTLYTQLLNKQAKAERDRLEKSKESMNSFLKEFSNYQEKRKAITEEYESKISKAQNDGERMMLIAQRNKAIANLDYSEWVDNGSIALAFGDISKLSNKTIERLIADMEKFRRTVIATFDPEIIQKYEEALTALRKSQSDDSFNKISSLVPDYFRERKSTGDQLESAGRNVIALDKEKINLQMRADTLEASMNVTRKMGGDTSQMEAELREVNVQLTENETATQKAKNAFNLLQEQWDKLESPQAKFEALCITISNISDFIGDLTSQASEMCEYMGEEGLGQALSTLGETLDSFGNIASGFAQGGIVGGIAAAAGEMMKLATKIFQAGDNGHQKNIERLQEQIDELDKSYERLGKSIDKAYSTDASELIGEQNTLLEQQKVLIEQQLAEEEAKKKSDKAQIKEYKERLEEIEETIAENKEKAKEAIIGEDLKGAIDEFAGLYAEAWNDGTDAAQKSMAAVRSIISSALTEMLKKDIQPTATKFYDALAEAMEDGVLTDAELKNLDAIKAEMDAVAAKGEEQWKKIQERYRDLDELREELTDISYDSVRDNFKSLLSDMESSTADFTDSFTDMLRNALIEGLMSSKYDRLLDEWYMEFADAMENGELSDSERDALRQKYESIVEQGIADRDAINSIVGGGAFSQSATSGGWASMGQDTAEELNGRFTALTELNVINNSLVSEGNLIAVRILETLNSLSQLSMMPDRDDSTLSEIRDMMFLSTGHLEDISKYTRQLITIRDGIDRLNTTIIQRL